MSEKRLRIIAGPNGSGKSTFVEQIQTTPPTKNFSLGYYINADDIEKNLKKDEGLNIEQFGIKCNTTQIQKHFKTSKFAPVKLNNPELYKSISIEHNKIKIADNEPINSYIAADIAEFIRQDLLKKQLSFSYETVMSDKKKISFLKKAKNAGYKIYLYFFTTEDPLININRIEVRVKQKGHKVNPEVVKKRYYKSLENLKEAVKLSNRAYLFDNSQQASILIAEITEGKEVEIIDIKNIPNWFVKYIYEKK